MGIIDLAMDKYSRKRTDASLSDSQLISEALENTPEHHNKEGLADTNSLNMPDPEAMAGSYGAMLKSYAKRNKQQGIAAPPTDGYAPSNQPGGEYTGGYVPVDSEEDDGRHGDSYDLNLALSLNYEVCHHQLLDAA